MAAAVIRVRDNQSPHLYIGRKYREKRMSSKSMLMIEYTSVSVILHERKRES